MSLTIAQLILMHVLIIVCIGIAYFYRQTIYAWAKKHYKKLFTIGIAVSTATMGVLMFSPPPVGDPPDEDVHAYDYEYFYTPDNSFGMSDTVFKTVNWTHFKQLFRNNFQVSLEYRISDTWVENNDYLDVNFDWQEEGF